VRLPVFVLVIACFVTAVDLSMQAWFYELYKVLGIFVPLIVVNCVIIARAEAFASKNRVGRALLDGFATGLGFTMALTVLGGMRELLGQGTLFAQANLMFGDGARGLTLSLGPHFHGALVAILPPGAFIGLGVLIALKNVIDRRLAQRKPAVLPQPEVEAGPAGA
jgi:H+/Na+-translocating ferredoxin:NAD+ oxidoreductase subunit E